jgi:nucleoside 2-deoxyribosyltransferase
MSYVRSVYLAGPISSTAYDATAERRLVVRKQLESVGIRVFDPLKDAPKELSGEQGDLDAKAIKLGYTALQIVTHCLDALQEQDLLLVDLEDYKQSGAQTWGTPCEMIVAAYLHMPIVVIANDYHSSWIDVFATHQAASVNGAIALIRVLDRDDFDSVPSLLLPSVY